MTPTPEQLKQWREAFEHTEWAAELKKNSDGSYTNNYIEGVWQGYLRAKAEQAVQQEGEPVGIVVYKPKMLRVGALNTAGMALPDGTRLYTRPPAPRKITANDVTDAMVDIYFKDVPRFKDYKAVVAAAVNAYLLEKL